MPSSKYKKYISLISGFILILIMLSPIANSLNIKQVFEFKENNMLEVTIDNAIEQQVYNIAHELKNFKLTSVKKMGNKIVVVVEKTETSDENLEALSKMLSEVYKLELEVQYAPT